MKHLSTPLHLQPLLAGRKTVFENLRIRDVFEDHRKQFDAPDDEDRGEERCPPFGKIKTMISGLQPPAIFFHRRAQGPVLVSVAADRYRLRARLLARVEALANALLRRYEKARAARMLNGLSDRELIDMGFTRGQIPDLLDTAYADTPDGSNQQGQNRPVDVNQTAQILPYRPLSFRATGKGASAA